jgi:hypothetical protein
VGGGQSRRLRSRACTPACALPLLVCVRARARVHAVCARARGLMSHVGEERDTRLDNPQPLQLMERLCTSRHPLRRAGGRRSRGRARLALSRAGRPASPESRLRHRSGDEGRLGGHTETRSETLRSKVYPSLPGKTTLYLAPPNCGDVQAHGCRYAWTNPRARTSCSHAVCRWMRAAVLGEVAADEARGYRLRACSMRDVTCGSPISAVFTCSELRR